MAASLAQLTQTGLRLPSQGPDQLCRAAPRRRRRRASQASVAAAARADPPVPPVPPMQPMDRSALPLRSKCLCWGSVWDPLAPPVPPTRAPGPTGPRPVGPWPRPSLPLSSRVCVGRLLQAPPAGIACRRCSWSAQRSSTELAFSAEITGSCGRHRPRLQASAHSSTHKELVPIATQICRRFGRPRQPATFHLRSDNVDALVACALVTAPSGPSESRASWAP